MSEAHPFANDLVRDFHDLYRSQTPSKGPPWVSWMGVNCLKCPLDLWVYQEILWELKPDAVIEGGTASGGSALFLAHVLDAIGHGMVITIDWERDPRRPQHPRIVYVTGNTLEQSTVDSIGELLTGFKRRVLILDDGHAHYHVERELELYTPFLRNGDYLIVEDTNLGGPLWGLDRFLLDHPGKFERDPTRERLLLTFNPRGYLRCIA